MEIVELFSILACGEDSQRQFKKNVNNSDSLAADMVAFSNGLGGKIFIGVNDDGSISGLSDDDVRRINQLISNTASQGVQPAINPMTENIKLDMGFVVIVDISAGINKPYQDKNGVFWVKSGADKRKATSREEIQRLFQASMLIHADEIPIPGASVADLDLDYFNDFFLRRFGNTLKEQPLSLPTLLKNMNLLNDELLNLSCVLLFAREPQFRLPVFIVKAAAFDSNDLDTNLYNDSRDIGGKLSDVFRQTISFILDNVRHVQGEQGINSVGIPEIPRESLEEIISNALVHRNYFISAPVRVFVFRNRVEVISPGHLPNNLTVENIKSGNSNARNPLLASFANNLLPYRGYGSGIIRALKKYPHIEFTDDRDGNLFKVTLRRNGVS
ncbi:MAG: putative DNA binding domain-containing protein [Clostridiales Family XIII bacterium]|jgi:ATP-dependent DNA helicase RecG|nr:putative DNA binding domain-containing protein [Clostridiales Family XIII bacterium]